MAWAMERITMYCSVDCSGLPMTCQTLLNESPPQHVPKCLTLYRQRRFRVKLKWPVDELRQGARRHGPSISAANKRTMLRLVTTCPRPVSQKKGSDVQKQISGLRNEVCLTRLTYPGPYNGSVVFPSALEFRLRQMLKLYWIERQQPLISTWLSFVSVFYIIYQLSGFLTDRLTIINPYPTAFPYGNGMVLHFYQQKESSTTKTVHKVINKGLKAYVQSLHNGENFH